MSVVSVVQHETKQGDGQNNIATTEICALWLEMKHKDTYVLEFEFCLQWRHMEHS